MTCVYNIALKSPEERHKIQLDLQASKAIYELRKGAKDRYQIQCQIAGMSEGDQSYFRQRLNHYQEAR